MPESHRSIVEQSYASAPAYKEVMAGQPENFRGIKTLRDLLSANYKVVDSREQMRKNLASLMGSGRQAFPGIVGYDDDVLPAMYRSILAGHDMLLIGQMGQAKTRLVQTAAETLLSPMPVIRQSLTNDCPMDLPAPELIALLDDTAPERPSPNFFISPESASAIRDNGLDTRISWADGSSRFRYVLATPDISVKDLVGYIDAIKIAKQGTEMYKIESYSPGQLMQAKHGAICIDELPVLDPRKQVALLSVLQEGRFTTGAYPVVFEPRTVFFATANPVDYTHSGKVIEPLYDRLKSHIYTHYPGTVEDEMMIIMQEAQISQVRVPAVVLRMLAQVVHKMRASQQINQERGVSVRLGIHGLELLAGEAHRCRAPPPGAPLVPRPVDMYCLEQVAKFELTDLDDGISARRQVFSDLLTESMRDACLEVLSGAEKAQLESVGAEFADRTFHVSQQMRWSGAASYESQLADFGALRSLVHSCRDAFVSYQEDTAARTARHGIGSDPLAFPPECQSELLSVLVEMVLEGLRWSTPKILERRDAGYVSA